MPFKSLEIKIEIKSLLHYIDIIAYHRIFYSLKDYICWLMMNSANYFKDHWQSSCPLSTVLFSRIWMEPKLTSQLKKPGSSSVISGRKKGLYAKLQVSLHLKRDIPISQRYPLNLDIKAEKLECTLVYASVLCELNSDDVTLIPRKSRIFYIQRG